MSDEKKFEVPGMVSIVSTKKKTVQHQEDFEKVLEPQGVGTTVEEMYDRYSRLLYVVDASGSMGEGMQQEDRADQYLWTDAALDKLRKAIAADPEKEIFDEDEPEPDPDWDEEDMEDVSPRRAEQQEMTEEELKNHVVDNNLHGKYGVHLRYNPAYKYKSRSKMQAVKEAARDFVTARFKKYSDALVTLFAFEGSPRMLAAGANEAQVLAGIDRLPDNGGGSTDIYRAVERALTECENHLSVVKRHHIVLVSDGLDRGALQVPNLLPKMLENGVVFDFVFIKGTSRMDAIDPDVLECLKAVCERTGGEFQMVETEKDFQQKFLAASSRKMLPAYAGK